MTKAIILAAGMGTRLRPLTNDRPKCLVELNGRPLLEHQIKALHSNGISDIHVVGGYKADALSGRGVTLHINDRYETTNMVYTLFRAERELSGAEDVVVSYGDIVYEPSVLEKLLQCNAEICVVSDQQWLKYWTARFTDPLDDAETFEVDDEGLIRSLGKKSQQANQIGGQFIGLMKFRADSLPHLKAAWSQVKSALCSQGTDAMYTTDFLQHLINSGWEVKSVPIENGWAEVDSPSDLALASQFYSSPSTL